MDGKRERRRRKWETYDKILQTLYGVDTANMDTCKPIFGSGVRLLLCTSHSKNDIQIEEHGGKVTIHGKNEELLQPTYLNLACHFNMLDWIERNINKIVRKSNDRISAEDIDERFIENSKREEAKRFDERFAKPLRRELAKHGLYFYCLPSFNLEIDEKTGAPFTASGDEVLCILPMTVAAAKKYHLSNEEIMLLAPQVLWLVKNLAARGVIRTHKQLIVALDEWYKYVSLPTRQHVIGLLREARSDLMDGE